MAGARLAAKAGSGFGILLLFLAAGAGPLFGQSLSGRWEIGAELIPQTTSYQATAFDFGLYSQLDLGLDFAGLGFDGTLYFSNLGLGLVWLGWDAAFPPGEIVPAATKRTLAANDWIKVVRSFPSPVRPGEAFEVTIIVEALQAIPPAAELTVIEELPRGWAIEPIAPAGARVARETQQWTLTLGGPGTREEIRYIAYVPSEAAAGYYTIMGTVRSELFPDLLFRDEIEVIVAPLAIPGRVRLSQDLIFAAKVSSGGLIEPLAFRAMRLNSYFVFDPQLKFTNYFSLYNVGTAQTPALSSRDLLIVEGKATGGASLKLALQFSSDSALAFDYGSLGISGLSLAGLPLRATTGFDSSGFKGTKLEGEYSAEILGVAAAFEAGWSYNKELQLELSYLSIRLSERIDGLLRCYDYYGWLSYDEPNGDGTEEEHFELIRRLIYFEFSLDKLEIRSTSTFRPILEDIDGDSAKEKVAASRLVRQELRLRRALKGLTFTGFFIWTAEEPLLAPLELSLIRFQLAFSQRSLRLTSTTSLDLRAHGFAQAVEAAISF
jgi:hypothetical protein